jgi:predicted GTPase
MANLGSIDHKLILVLGATGAGKTTVNIFLLPCCSPNIDPSILQFINSATGSDLKVGHGQESETTRIHFSKTVEVEGEKLVLFDSPGFDDTYKDDSIILQEIGAFLRRL